MRNTPDYAKIYTDILNKRYPDKKKKCETLLNKEDLSMMDIIALNRTIFGEADNVNESFNQRHRSYSKGDVLKILDYQKSNRLNNTQISNHFKLSRNTIARWKKLFLV